MQLAVFDLDNTMVDETEWLFAAYRTIAQSIESKTGKSARVISDYLMDRFVKRGRKDLFQDLCTQFDLPLNEIDEWLDMMRSVRLNGGYQVFDWVVEFCHSFSAVPKAILTNGNPRQQESKFYQLTPVQLQREFKLYCASDFTPKPSPLGLLQIIHEFQVPPNAVVFIGDSDEDRACAAGANAEFIDAASFRFQDVPKIMSQISNFISQRFGSVGRGQDI